MKMERTPSQTAGPFFTLGLCVTPQSELVPAGSDGAFTIAGTVFDGAGAAVPDALLEIWQPDVGWGRCGTDGDGGYRFVTRRPAASDGQAPHVEMLVFARGMLKPARTRVYLAGEDANDDDPLLSGLSDEERAGLLGEESDGGIRFDVRLQGDRQTTFFAL